MSFWDSMRSGVNSIPIVGGVTSGVWGDPAQEAHQKQLEQNKKQLQQYRPVNMQGRMNAMNQSALAFEPLQKLMAQMYGQGAVPNMQGMLKNPMPQEGMDQMYQAAYGRGAPPVNNPNPFGQGGTPPDLQMNPNFRRPQ
jgi:hypothetical protein